MKKTILFLFVTTLLAGSCSFFNDDYRETVDQFVSVAYRADNTDFSQYKTYVVADSLLYVDGDKNLRKKNNLSDEVKSAVAQEMNALGYTPYVANPNSKPDLIIDLAYIVTTTTTIYPGYWWGWDYWYYYDWFFPYFPYDPYYPGGYYPGGFYPYYPYPMYPMSSSYSTGSLTMDMVDLKNYKEGANPPIVWHGLVRSILNSTHTSQERSQAIHQCFEMMPPANTKK